MCVSFDQIIGNKRRKQVNQKENNGKERVQTFNISLGLACKKGMQCFVGLGHILVANNCGQWSDFACDLSKGKCEERWCIIIVFLVKEILPFVFIGCIFVGRYCIWSKLDYGYYLDLGYG
jgi:hypothetical protein